MHPSDRIRLFADSAMAVRAQFFEDISPMPRLGGLLLASSGRQALEELEFSKQQLLQESPAELTAEGLPFLAAALAVAAEPDRTLRCWQAAASMLAQTYSAAAYTLPAAALLVRFLPDGSDMKDIIAKSKQTYDELSLRHPLLTGYEDVGALLLLALQGRENDTERIMQCSRLLKPLRCSGNLRQTLACILALYDEPEQAVEAFFCVKAALKEAGVRAIGGTALLGLAALASADCSPALLAAAIDHTSRTLKAMPGFGFFGATAQERLYYACMLAALEQHSESVIYCTALLGAVNNNLPDTPEPLLSERRM